MNLVFIYTLTDPETKNVRYVGQTKNPKLRFYRHIHDAKSNGKKNRRCAWIKSLLNKNQRPILEIIDEVEENHWMFWEQYWISQFKAWGFNLVNETTGGEGSYNRKTSDFTKMKMSLAKKGKLPKNYDLFRKSTIKNSVIQYDLNGCFIKKWDYIKQAMDETNIVNIKNVVDKKRCSAGGFIWRYTGDELTKEELKSIKIKHTNQQSKQVGQYDLSGNLLKIWTSVREIKKTYQHINSVLNGNRKTAGGYKWRFIL